MGRTEVLDLRIHHARAPSDWTTVGSLLLVAAGIVAGHIERKSSFATQHFLCFLSVPNIEQDIGYADRVSECMGAVKIERDPI